MEKVNRIVVGSLLGSLIVAGGLAVLVGRMQHRPTEAIDLASTFVELMINGRMEQAYSCTDRKTGVGRTLAEFDGKVTKEWRRHGGRQGIVEYRVREVGPPQSYGNRIRRFLRGRKVEMDTIHVDFYVQKLPFEVRLGSDDRGNWKVIYFQSHAL